MHNAVKHGFFNQRVIGLNEINHTANIGMIHRLYFFNHRIARFNVFMDGNGFDEFEYFLFRQLIETNANEFILEGFINLADIIANQTKPNIGYGGLQQIFQGLLCVFGHIIHLIQHHEFDAIVKNVFRGDELKDLIAYDVNTTLIRGIQMYDVSLIDKVIVDIVPFLVFLNEIDDSGGLARTRRPVKQQIRKCVFFDDVLEQSAVDGVQYDFVEMMRSVFFNPRYCVFGCNGFYFIHFMMVPFCSCFYTCFLEHKENDTLSIKMESTQPESSTFSQTETILKKRGRKKKVVDETEPFVVEEDKNPKKRGRKARGAKLIVKSENINETHTITLSNVILHLKCCLSDLNEYNSELSKIILDPLNYNPLIPPNITSYNETAISFATGGGGAKGLISYNDNDTFTVYKEDTEPTSANIEKEFLHDTSHVCQCNEKKKTETKDMAAKLKNLKIMLYKNAVSTDKIAACFWCSYDFDNPPFYIPKHEMNDTMFGYGSFCRPECAVAYLFNERIDDSCKYERYQWINNIYGRAFDYKKNIKPAPDPHYLLEKFYGNLTIQEYRKLFNTQHNMMIVEKPMTRVLPELHDDSEGVSMMGNKTGVYKVKRESEKEQGPSKSSIIRDKFGLSN